MVNSKFSGVSHIASSWRVGDGCFPFNFGFVDRR